MAIQGQVVCSLELGMASGAWPGEWVGSVGEEGGELGAEGIPGESPWDKGSTVFPTAGDEEPGRRLPRGKSTRPGQQRAEGPWPQPRGCTGGGGGGGQAQRFEE